MQQEKQKHTKSLLVCYGKLDPKTISDYTNIIIEPSFYSKKEVQLFRSQNKNVYAYLSLAEVNEYSKSFHSLKEFTIGKNKNWNSYLLNLNVNQTKVVLENQIADFVSKNYSGVFLDNLDNFGSFGLQTYQKKSALDFIEKIAGQFPTCKFIQNRGFEMIENTHQYIHAIVAESILSSYNFEEKKYQIKLEAEYKKQLKQIQATCKAFKKELFLIEYTKNFDDYKSIYTVLQNTKCSFYIGTIDLQTEFNSNLLDLTPHVN